MIVLKRRFIGRNSTKLYLLVSGHILRCHVTNATPTVKINSTKYTRNDSPNSIDGDTAEMPADERHKGTCV